MDLIRIILVTVAVFIAVIVLFLSRERINKFLDPTGPEDEKEDPDPPKKHWWNSGYGPTDFHCGD